MIWGAHEIGIPQARQYPHLSGDMTYPRDANQRYGMQYRSTHPDDENVTECKLSEPELFALWLWAKVLQRAKRDLGERNRRGAALRWINDGARDVGSFQWVCNVLNCTVEKVRCDFLGMPIVHKRRFRTEHGSVARAI